MAALLVAMGNVSTAAAASQVINAGGGTNTTDGLRITLLDNTQLQVRRVNANQVYSPSQPTNGNTPNTNLYNGVFLAIGTAVYGPRSTVAVNQAMPTDWSLVSQSGVAGSGTSASPWTVITTVQTPGMNPATVRVTTQYVNGDDFFTESAQITPPSGNTSQIRYYHLIDTYLQGSDRGPGYVLPATGVPTVVGTFQGNTVYEEFLQGSRPWDDWYTAAYDTMFRRIRNGGSLNMTVDTGTNVDNGIGVQWNLGVLTSATTFDYRVSFRPTARCTTNMPCSGMTPVCNTSTGNCVAPTVTLTNPPQGMSITTTNQRPPIAGTGTPGQTVTVVEGATTICTATVNATGAWTCTPGANLSIATHNITARLSTASSAGSIIVQCSTAMQCGAGQICSMGACVTPMCTGNSGQGTARDCPIATPICTNPGTASAACSACNSGQVYNTNSRMCVAPAVTLTTPPAGGSQNTTNRMQPISGTGVPGQTVIVSEGAATVCMATVANNGTWTCTPGSNLSIGSHALTATSGGASSSGTLVVTCTMNNQCPMGQVCSMGACTTPSCTGNAGAGTARDCPIATPICSMPGTAGATCNACAMGRVYNTVTRTCVIAQVNLTQPPAGGSQNTTNTMLPVNGTGIPGATVTVTESGTTICSATVNNMGVWSCTPASAWTIASHMLTATSGGATSNGTLVVQCTMNAQCGGIQVCSMGACVTPTCTGNSGAGTARDCPSATPLCTNPGTVSSTCTTCPAGNVFNPVTHVCVPSAVSLSTPPAGGTLTTTNTMQPIAGTGVPGQTVTVREGSSTICMATVQNDSSWTCTPTSALSIGTHVLVASSGSASSSGTLVVRCTLDTQCSMGQVCGGGICVTPMCAGNNGAGTSADCPAATPLCSMPGTASATCTTCPSGQVFNTASHECVAEVVALTNPPSGGRASTMSQMPLITGTGVPGQQVTVDEAGSVLCTATVIAAGTWQCSPSAPLAIGAHPLRATSGGATSMGTLDVLCTANMQCSGNNVCNTMTGACVTPACTGNNGSGATLECAASTPVCQNPATAAAACAACPMGQFFDTTMQRCRGCAVATQTSDCMAPTVACNPNTGLCVMPAVTVTTPANNSVTSNGQPPIVGTATPLQTVTVVVDGMAIGTATADAMGAWTLTPTMPLAQGMHTVSARLTIGVTDTLSETNSFRVVGCTTSADCRAPTSICDTSTNTCRGCTVPTQSMDCMAPTAACDSATAQCVMPMVAIVTPMNGSTTTERRPNISGTATPGQTVEVRIDGMAVGTAVVDAMGTWTFVLSTELSLGMHRVQGRITLGGANTDSTESAFTVVGCASSADCMGATPICDAMTRVCRACSPMTASDCPTTAAPFCSTTGATTGTCVPQPPAIVTPANGSTTTSPSPVIRGAGPASATVAVFIDGMEVGRTMTDAMGAFTLTPMMSLPNGMHTVAAANVTGGVVGPLGTANTFTIVGCSTNADCMGATPVCDRGMMRCRPCSSATEAMDCDSPARPTCETTGPNAGMCVARAPTVTLPANGATIGTRRPDVVGVATPNSTVAVFIDGMEIGRAMSDAMGNFTVPTTADLSLGMHTVAAAIVDPSGMVGPRGRENMFTVAGCSASVPCGGGTPVCDAMTMMCRPCNPATESADCPSAMAPVCSTSGTAAGRCVPRVPTITQPMNGATTASRRPEVRGTAQPNGTVAVFIDGMEIGRAMTDAMGAFTLTLPRDLTPGMHSASAANVDAMGTTGVPGPSNMFTVPECTMDSECATALRCDTARGVCVPRDGDGGMMMGDASVDDGGTMTMDGGMTADASMGSDGGMMSGDGSMGMRDGSASGDGSMSGRDGSAEAGGLSITGNGACSCTTPGRPTRGSSSTTGLLVLGFAAAGALARRRRR